MTGEGTSKYLWNVFHGTSGRTSVLSVRTHKFSRENPVIMWVVENGQNEVNTVENVEEMKKLNEGKTNHLC